jgi:hypothetical protein
MSQDSINISVFETTEEVGIVVTPNITTVNVQQVTNTSLVKSVNGQTGDVVIPTSDNNFTTVLKNKLDGIETGAEVNVNADWNATSGDSEILNKPTIPAPVIVDSIPTDGSSNAVSSNGVFDALETKLTLPALTNGSVLFSNGTTIAEDNANFFWDDTNNRLGIGTNTPDAALDIRASSVGLNQLRLGIAGNNSWQIGRDNITTGRLVFASNGVERVSFLNTGFVGIGTTTPGARLDVRAQGALSTDIAFRVRNSADDRDLFSVNGAYCTTRSRFVTTNTTDTSVTPMIDLLRAGFGETLGAIIGQINFRGGFTTSPESRTTNGYAGINAISEGAWHSGALTFTTNPTDATIPTERRMERMRITSGGNILINTTTNAGFRLDVNGTARVQSTLKVGAATTQNASAVLDVESTTQGFLPPRMTNAQRLAIASPAVGLMVYCTDATEGLYINKSTGWTFII